MYRFAPRTQPSAYRPFYNGHNPAPAHWHDHDGNWDHNHHRGVYWYGTVYPYNYWYAPYPLFTGYVNPWLFGNCWSPWYGWSAWCDSGAYSSYDYSGDIAAPYREYGTDSGSGPYPQQYYQGEEGPPQPEPSAQLARPEYQLSGTSAAHGQMITVIFNDGRAPQQIENYLLTSSTLTVLGARNQEIPLARINLPATIEANRAAGIDFRVPIAQ